MWKFLVLLSLVLSVKAGGSPHGVEYFSQLSPEELSNIPEDIIEDAQLDVAGLLTKYGYVAETHKIETSDGYILTVFRIAGKNDSVIRDGKPVVFIMHGLMGSSSDFIVTGPEKGLGYILSNEGYDVWLGNARGNFYSRKHVSLNPSKSRKFWNFSWHEIGFIDVPTTIDYILEKTGKKKLHYIGHSQGTTSFFVMASSKPEYNNKILSMQALAPVAYMSNVESTVKCLASQYAYSIQYFLTLIGYNELLPKTKFLSDLAHKHCSEDARLVDFCIYILFGNENLDQVNKTLMPLFLSHAPAGASSKQFVHYGQLHLTPKFQQYDFGFIANLMIYNSFSPPKYKVKNISSKVALHYSDNDKSVAIEDVKRLHGELPNSIGLFRVPQDTFGHLDFIWANDVKTLLYDKIIEIIKMND